MFLEVKFHDNDFSPAFVDALSLLFESAGQYNKVPKHTLLALHSRGVLKTMLINMVEADNVIKQIRWATEAFAARGEDWPTPKWLKDDINAGYSAQYFKDVKLELHDNNTFMDENQNGEHCWLNLETGEAGQF